MRALRHGSSPCMPRIEARLRGRLFHWEGSEHTMPACSLGRQATYRPVAQRTGRRLFTLSLPAIRKLRCPEIAESPYLQISSWYAFGAARASLPPISPCNLGATRMYPTYLARITSTAEKACAIAMDRPKDVHRERLFDALAQVANPTFQGDDPELAHLKPLFGQAQVWAGMSELASRACVLISAVTRLFRQSNIRLSVTIAGKRYGLEGARCQARERNRPTPVRRTASSWHRANDRNDTSAVQLQIL